MSENPYNPISENPAEHEYPVPLKSMIYMNSITWIASFVQQVANGGDYTVEEIEAQVQKDLRFLIDQKGKPH